MIISFCWFSFGPLPRDRFRSFAGNNIWTMGLVYYRGLARVDDILLGTWNYLYSIVMHSSQLIIRNLWIFRCYSNQYSLNSIQWYISQHISVRHSRRPYYLLVYILLLTIFYYPSSSVTNIHCPFASCVYSSFIVLDNFACTIHW